MADQTDVTPPTLTENWILFGPPMHGDPRGVQDNSGGTPPTEPPSVRAYEVSPGSLEGASEAIQASTHAAIGAYNDVRDYIMANKGWVFDVASPDVLTSTQYIPFGDTAYASDPWDPNPEWTTQWSIGSDNLLLSVADTIRLAGQFLDAVNNAGQFYTKADKDSEVPPLDVATA